MRIVIVMTLLLAVTGCDWLSDEYEAITLDELNRLKCEWQEPKVSEWFYVGSGDGTHKFVHRDLPGDKLYEIKTSAYKVEKTMYLSSNEAYWVKMPWGPTYDECK